MFPDILKKKLFTPRRDVFFFGTPAGDDRFSHPRFPNYSEEGRGYYGFPSIDHRGFKVCPVGELTAFDPDTDERVVSSYQVKRARDYLALRFPALKDQPVVETRVCQLEMSVDEHFIIQKHPAFETSGSRAEAPDTATRWVRWWGKRSGPRARQGPPARAGGGLPPEAADFLVSRFPVPHTRKTRHSDRETGEPMMNPFLRRTSMLAALACLSLLLVACSSKPKVEPATLVLHKGRIVTVEDAAARGPGAGGARRQHRRPGHERGDRGLRRPATQVVDLGGRLAVPGLIEGHGHFTGVGQARIILNLMAVKNWDEVVAMVKDAAAKAKPGDWILGRGWHQAKWDKTPDPAVEGFPIHESLSARLAREPGAAHPRQRPRLVRQRQGHGAAGVTRASKNPPGGEILKDAKGEPIGIFRETAAELVEAAYAKARAGRTPEEPRPRPDACSSSPTRRCCRRGSRASRTPARASRRST